MEGYFGGCAPKFFLQKLSNIARFQFKNERDRRRTRGVTAVYFSVFILSQHGSIAKTGVLEETAQVYDVPITVIQRRVEIELTTDEGQSVGTT